MDKEIFDLAVAVASYGFKAEAYSILLSLIQNYPRDITLLLWLAYTAPDFDTAGTYLELADRLAPDNRNVARARKWLDEESKAQVTETGALVKVQPAENEELKGKKAELAGLESRLVQLEQELATVEAELHEFEAQYLSSVGQKMAELDEIEAKIAEILATQQPEDPVAAEFAERARARAKDSWQATTEAQEQVITQPKFQPTETIKQLYRKAAKLIHPDLADSEADRENRTRLMAELNHFYAAGDTDGLQLVLVRWQQNPGTLAVGGTGTEFERTLHKITQVNARISELEAILSRQKGSELYRLKTKVKSARDEGLDLLAAMAQQVSEEIEQVSDQLYQLRELQYEH